MAVFIKLGSGVVTPGVTQASATISNTKTDKRFGTVFDIFLLSISDAIVAFLTIKSYSIGCNGGFA